MNYQDIERIAELEECERVGLPAPEINTDGNFVWVVFKYNRNSVVVTPQLPHSYPTVNESNYCNKR